MGAPLTLTSLHKLKTFQILCEHLRLPELPTDYNLCIIYSNTENAHYNIASNEVLY